MDREVIFYQTARGESPVQKFLEELSDLERAKCVSYMVTLQGLGMPGYSLSQNVAKKVQGDLWELRPEYNGVEFRFFYFLFLRDRVVIVHAIKKKQQRLNRGDIDLALARAVDYKERHADDKKKDK